MEKLDNDLMSGEFILCFVNSEYREFPVFAVLIRKRQQNSEDKGFFEFEIAGIDIGFKIKLFDDLLDFFFSLSCYPAPGCGLRGQRYRSRPVPGVLFQKWLLWGWIIMM